MSEENVEIVRQGYEALNAFMRDELTSEALAKFVDPEIEFHWHDERTYPDEPQHLRGVPGFMRWVGDIREAMDEVALEPLEFIEAPGERMLIPTRQSGRGRESGVPIEAHYFQLVKFRNGKAREVEIFRHRADALNAAGLRE